MDSRWQNEIITVSGGQNRSHSCDTMTATFRAPWGMSLRLTSAITTVILPGIVLTFRGHPWGAAPIFSGPFLLLALLPLLLLPITAAFMVLGYSIEDNFLVIKRLGWRTTIALRGLRSAEFDPAATKGSVRIFGNGGLYSFTGLFWNKTLGRYRAFLTDTSRAVVLKLPDRTIVLSPEKPEEFIRELRNRELLPRNF